MAVLQVKKLVKNSDLSLPLVAADVLGDTFKNNGHEIIVVKNSDVDAVTVTITGEKQCSHGFLHDLVVSVAIGATEYIGPFDPTRFNDVDSILSIAYSDANLVTVGVLSTK